MICCINGCDGKATRRQMCQKHYRRVKAHGDPHKTNRRRNADGKGYRGDGNKGLHVRIAEMSIGKTLPIGTEVHHVNGDPSDNSNSNLVICQSRKYHSLLHIRERAFIATGDVNQRKCKICLKHSPISEVIILENGAVYHPECNRKHVAKYASRKKEELCQ